MRLLQLNCWSGKLATQITRLGNKYSPEIICLQEDFLTSLRPGSVVASSNDMFPEIDYPYRAFGKVFSARYMKELSDFGNSIISSFTLIDKNVIYTKGNTIEDIETLNTEYDYNIRNFVHAVFEIGESTLNIITHHGHHDPFSKEGSDENTRQMQILADYIALLKGPVILTGDFNLHPKSSSLEPINKLLRNLAVEYNIESTRSELAKRQEVIDYIFVSDDLVVNDFYASEMIVSDHKALILEFDL